MLWKKLRADDFDTSIIEVLEQMLTSFDNERRRRALDLRNILVKRTGVI